MCVNQSKRRTKEKAEVEGEKVVVEAEVEVEGEKVAEEGEGERLVSLLKKIVTNMSETFLVEKCFLKEHNLLLLLLIDDTTSTD